MYITQISSSIANLSVKYNILYNIEPILQKHLISIKTCLNLILKLSYPIKKIVVIPVVFKLKILFFKNLGFKTLGFKILGLEVESCWIHKKLFYWLTLFQNEIETNLNNKGGTCLGKKQQ